ncbi:MAG TPA: hypothetical protein VFS29_01700 [Motilibacteraceae bacterium]|nr:hypothetical protein [Motilibacteraceae bacterium]
MRGNLLGSSIAAVFGLVYVAVNTGPLPAPVAWPLRALALLAFLAVAVAVARRRGRDDASGASAGGVLGLGRAYWTVVLVEALALFGGVRVLSGPLGRPEAGVAWVSLVVGVHFFALAVVFGQPSFHLLGAAVTACGAVGMVLALSGAPVGLVDLVAGVLPGALLLAAAWWGAHREPGAGVEGRASSA